MKCLFLFLIVLIFREGGGRKKGKETLMCKININQLPPAGPQPGTWPATQACALTRNQTHNLQVHGATRKPPTHTSQGCFVHFKSWVLLTELIIRVLYVYFGYSLFSDMYIVTIFSLVGLPFHFFNDVLQRKKFLILKSSLSIFSFMISVFLCLPRNLYLPIELSWCLFPN